MREVFYHTLKVDASSRSCDGAEFPASPTSTVSHLDRRDHSYGQKGLLSIQSRNIEVWKEYVGPVSEDSVCQDKMCRVSHTLTSAAGARGYALAADDIQYANTQELPRASMAINLC